VLASGRSLQLCACLAPRGWGGMGQRDRAGQCISVISYMRKGGGRGKQKYMLVWGVCMVQPASTQQ
jgi:hypothetical protein